MFSLSFTVSTPYICTFRVPTSTSILRSFTVPPFTTIRGMLSNAMGLQRDDFYLQNSELRIGLKVIRQPLRSMETARMLKYVARNESEQPVRRSFPSSPMTKELLFAPEYRIYLVGVDNLLSDIKRALENPLRPLYLGQSDDLTVVSDLHYAKTELGMSEFIDSIIEGIHSTCEIVKLPYKYGVTDGSRTLICKTFSLPNTYPCQLDKMIECHFIGQEHVAVY
jgi:CRISPR-associated protein Cas5h